MKFEKPFIPQQMEHFDIYRNENEFCSWPFNGGMWRISSEEIVVAFMNIEADYSVPLNMNHDRVEQFGKIIAARTTDGGKTWQAPTLIADNRQLMESLKYGKQARIEEPYDFSDPNVLLECWCTPNSAVPDAKAWVKLSKDGGRSWTPAVMLPECNIPRNQGRPSYIVRPDGVILLFVTGQPAHNPHDRPLVYASFDDGQNWRLISMMPNSQEYRMICPSPVLMDDGEIFVAVRCKHSIDAPWDELYASDDGGRTWRFVSRINDHGDTVHLTKLHDGRLFAVYGYRCPPFGIRAKISEDRGKTWGPEMILRDDGGSKDLGYPRAVERVPGEVIASYYFNDKYDSIQQLGGVRYIGGTRLKV